MSDQPRFNDAGVLRSEKINRIEVVSRVASGSRSAGGATGATLHLQDDGQTLKIFIDEEVKLDWHVDENA